MLYAQQIYMYLIPESIEAATENTEYIQNEPNNILNSQNEPTESEGESAFGVEVESIISPRSMFVKLPLSYSRRSFSISAAIPYLIKREMTYISGKKSANGLGDALINGSWRYGKARIMNEFQLGIKLPTGDENKVVDGFLVPLGTGSTDIVFANKFDYFGQRYKLQSQISYRLNNNVKRIAEISLPNGSSEIVEYDISMGDTFIWQNSISYELPRQINLIGNLALIANARGSMDRTYPDSPAKDQTGISANQDFTFLDFSPGVSVKVYKVYLIFSVKTPLYTSRNSINSEEDRSIQYLFRLSSKLF